MFEVSDARARTFDARLRGVDVTCQVALGSTGQPDIRVFVPAVSLDSGLRAVSKFAGYCRRTLALPSGEDDAWAAVLASYFGFGLVLVSEDERREVMPPPFLDVTDDGQPRQAFTRRVLSELSGS